MNSIEILTGLANDIRFLFPMNGLRSDLYWWLFLFFFFLLTRIRSNFHLKLPAQKITTMQVIKVSLVCMYCLFCVSIICLHTVILVGFLQMQSTKALERSILFTNKLILIYENMSETGIYYCILLFNYSQAIRRNNCLCEANRLCIVL